VIKPTNNLKMTSYGQHVGEKYNTTKLTPHCPTMFENHKVLHNHVHVIIGLLQKTKKCFPMQIAYQG